MATDDGGANGTENYGVPARWERPFAVATGCFISTVGAITLVGWLAGIEPVVAPMPGMPGLNPIAAACFFLIGIAIVLEAVGRGRAAAIVGAIVALAGAYRLIGTIANFPSAVEFLIPFDAPRWVFRDLRGMSLYAALSFALSGCIFVARRIQPLREIHAVEILATVTAMLSSIGVLSLVVGVSHGNETILYSGASVQAIALFWLFSGYAYARMRTRVPSEYAVPFVWWATVMGILFICVLVSVLVAGLVDASVAREQHQRFLERTYRASHALESKLAMSLGALRGAGGLFAASREVEPGEWSRYVQSLEFQERFPWIREMGYADVDASMAFGNIPVAFVEATPEGGLTRAGDNLGAMAPVSDAARRAEQQGEAVISAAVMDGDVAMVFGMDPVYAAGAVGGMAEGRQGIVRGFVYVAIDTDRMVKSLLEEEDFGGLSLAGRESSQTRTLFSVTRMGANDDHAFTVVVPFTYGGVSWQLSFSDAPEAYATKFSRSASLLTILGGIGTSILVALAFYTLVASRHKSVVYAHRVTADLRRANRSLGREKARIEAMIAGIGEGIAVADERGAITYMNERAVAILGVDTLVAEPESWQETFGVFDPQTHDPWPTDKMPLLEAVRGRLVQDVRLHIRNARIPKGAYISVTATPIVVDGKPSGAVAVFRDITREQEVDRAKTEFVSIASHQLRTPLSTINWYAEMLLGGDAGSVSPKQREFLARIEESSRRMTELVTALLNVSRIDLGTFAVEPVPTDVVGVAREVVSELEPKIRERKIDFDESYETLAPVMADPTLLRVVFQNLLSNAVKYTPEGGSVRLRVGREKGSGNILVSVADTGYGVPAEARPKMFTKLFRADNIRARVPDGTGLGLYIVRAIVERSGGRVWYDSAEGRGSTFYASFPASGMKKKIGTKKLT